MDTKTYSKVFAPGNGIRRFDQKGRQNMAIDSNSLSTDTCMYRDLTDRKRTSRFNSNEITSNLENLYLCI